MELMDGGGCLLWRGRRELSVMRAHVSNGEGLCHRRMGMTSSFPAAVTELSRFGGASRGKQTAASLVYSIVSVVVCLGRPVQDMRKRGGGEVLY